MDQRSKIAILGYGVEGRAIFNYLRAHEYSDITICDQDMGLKEKMPDGVSVRLGPKYLNDLTDFDVVFRSPGIRYLDARIQAAVVGGAEVTSSTKFFMDQCPCPMIGVTGTKGKGTTCTLIYEMLKKGGKKVHLGGNIGKSPMTFLDDLEKDEDIVVLELSSFQLQDAGKSPRYAILLNTTTDHLDYHADSDEYMKAKENLVAHQPKDALAVLNKDYEYVNFYKSQVKGELKWTSVHDVVEDGAYLDDGKVIYVKKGKSEEICRTEEVALTGAHNLENVMPAVIMAKEFGISNEDIRSVIMTFKGLPHRLQFIREMNGVKFYNDSNATAPEPSMAAVDSFEEPTVLIAGGVNKGFDYGEWALRILTKPNLHTIILIGASADEMEKELIEAEEKLVEAQGSPTKIIRRNSLDDAVLDGYAESDEGGVVVLSPAAASFDMFENYKERGKKFMAAVMRLK